jgi:hypothetical protein
VVVLPAPLGPSSEKIVPSGTSRSMPSSTTWSPNDLRNPAALIANWDELAGMLPPSRRLRTGSGLAGCSADASSCWAMTSSLTLDSMRHLAALAVRGCHRVGRPIPGSAAPLGALMRTCSNPDPGARSRPCRNVSSIDVAVVVGWCPGGTARPGRELARASARRVEADQTLERLTATNQQQRQGRAMLRLPWRAGPAGPTRGRWRWPPAGRPRPHHRTPAAPAPAAPGRLEANAHLGPADRQVVRELAWQRRARGLAAEHDQPGYLRDELGPVPESTRGRRAWRQAAAEIEQYRRAYQITDPDRALGPSPTTRPSGPTASGPAPPSSGFTPSSGPPTAAATDTQSISERNSQPRSRQQSGRQGPERAAG